MAGGANKVAPDAARDRALAIAVAPARSADGATRLLVNPQGPFGGVLSWYEARIVSGEGWNMAGGLIPGSPVLLAGAGPDMGWGIAPNHPDLADVYTLEANPNDRYFYRFDNEWRRLESREARIVARLWGPIRITFRREILRSKQGPAIRNARGLFAVHYAGQDDLRGVEAFFRLNKASNFEGFTAALAAGGIPSLDFVYADRTGRIASLYNGAFPDRAPGYDWTRPVPGNSAANLWNAYLPATAAPRTIAPGSGFVIAANATPFRATADPFNPKPEGFSPSMGIETGLNNRTRRALVLFSADRSITADKMRAYKFDACYAPDSDFAVLVKGIGQRNYAGDPLLEEAGEMLRRYSLCTNKTDRGAALAQMTAAPLLQASASGIARPEPAATLRATANRLLSQFGRLDPIWGEVSRLRRGSIDVALNGGPDVLRDVEVQPRLDRNGTSAARAGDSLTFLSSWTRDGRWQVESIVPFGASNMPGAPHYADQTALFAGEKLKSLPLTADALSAEATQIDRPGRPPPPKGSIIVPPIPIPPNPAAMGVRPLTAAERKSVEKNPAR
jgi:penicillin amidase/acyl-homoserine-lactone acylase